VVVALNRGAGSLALALPSTGPAVVQSRQETSKPTSAERKVFRVLMEWKFITEGFYIFLGFGVSVRDVSQRLKPEGFIELYRRS